MIAPNIVRIGHVVLQVTNLADKYYHFQLLRGSINKQTRVGAPREWLLTLRRNF